MRCADVAVDMLSVDDIDWAEGVALSVPMHTAMRLALRVAGRRAGAAGRACPCASSACTPGWLGNLQSRAGAPGDAFIAGEFEPGVVAWADGAGAGSSRPAGPRPGPGARASVAP